MDDDRERRDRPEPGDGHDRRHRPGVACELRREGDDRGVVTAGERPHATSIGGAPAGSGTERSIVGVDRAPGLGYYRAKAHHEDILKAGPIPFSIVRATQFFEFIEEVMSWTADGGTVRLPSTPVQPIAAADAAQAVADAATGTPLDGIRDVAGPDVLPLDELGRITLAARGDARIAATHYRDWLTG